MAETGPALWIDEAAVAGVLDLRSAIDAVEGGVAAEARGAARNMLKTHVAWGDGATLHAIGAVWPEVGVAGSKTWAHTPGGATPLLLLFDAASGALLAVIEAFALGQLRTGAVSGVATRWLAAPAADALAVIGSGKQALAQVAAVAAVRPLRRVRVFSPDAGHRAAFAARARAALDLAVETADSVRAAVVDAPIVTVVTRAREPFLAADMLAAGCHVNAIGAITPERAELDGDVLERCALVAADSVASVQQLSRELRDYYGSRDWSAVVSLGQVVTGAAPRRAGDLTLFKAMGMGISDLAVGFEVLQRARRAGAGRVIPAPIKAEIDWRAR